MNDMKELVTVEQVEHAIRIAAVGIPAAGLLVGMLVGAARRRLKAGVGIGLACGAAGPAIWVTWRAYNAVAERYGLDSVRGLVVNIALFTCIGVGVGLAVGYAARVRRTQSPEGKRPLGHL